MSRNNQVSGTPPAPGRTERWFIVLTSSFAPLAVAFMVPPAFVPALCGVAVLLALAGLFMLLRKGLF